MEKPPDFSDGNASFRRALRKVVDYAKKHGVHPGGRHGWSASPNGWIPPVTIAAESLRMGFQVYKGQEENKYRVWFSIVTGMDLSKAVPVINGTKLGVEPPPEIEMSDGNWIGLYFEAEPDTEQFTPQVGDDVWRIKDGGGSIEDDIEVRVYGSLSAMESATVPALINPATGDTVKGRYVLPLAQLVGGKIRQYGFFGPIGIRMCASGHVSAFGSLRVIYEPIPPDSEDEEP
jgi:hypothetical protein